MHKVVSFISFLLIIISFLIYPHNTFSFNNNSLPANNKETFSSDLGVPNFQAYNEEGKLKQFSAMAVAFDKKGYLWVATQEGATYYNGRRWISVSLPNNSYKDLRAITVRENGNIIFGSLGGGVYSLENGKWGTFDKNSMALPNDNVRSLLETTDKNGQQVLWVGTDGGLAKHSQNKWITLNSQNSPLPNNTINVLLESFDKNGQQVLWIGTQGGLVSYSQDEWKVFDNKNSPLPNINITALLESVDKKGQTVLWIGTQGGLVSYSQDEWKVFDNKDSPALNTTINALQETISKNGTSTLWVGTFGGGLAKYINNEWFTFNSKNSSLPNNNIRSLVKRCSDGHCTMWIGTLGGLTKYEEDRWNNFTINNSPLPGNDTRKFLESRSANGERYYWIATEGGLVKYEKNKWTIFDTSNSPLPSNFVITLLESQSKDNEETLWIGTTGGLVKYTNENWTIFNTKNSPLPTNLILTLLESISSDGSRSLWIGTARGGMAKYEDGNWTVFTTENSPLPNNYVGAFLETISKNNTRSLWIGTAGGGLAKYENGNWTVFTNKNSSLPNNYVVSLKEITASNGKAALWIGTSAGLAFFDLESEKWINSSDKNLLALSDQVISSIEEDPQKRIYLCTFNKIVRLTPNSSNINGSEYEAYVFTQDDGLPSKGVVPLATMMDSSGYFWIGSLSGIGILDTSKTIIDKLQKPLLIENILVNGEQYLNKKKSPKTLPNETKKILIEHSLDLDGASLNYDENNITFEFALLSYFKESETLYQTQLEGFEKLSDWTKEYKRVYTNLNQGNYVFKVLAKDSNGNISGPLTVKFTIKPALWHTWWAYSLYIIVLFSIAFSIGYRQVNKTKQRASIALQRQQEQALLKESQLRAEAAELQAKAAETQAKAVEEENQRKNQELEYARQMQLSLLPKQNISLDKIEIVGKMRTATEVGGDYYDFLKIDDTRYLLVIGDATGHGVAAGLIVGMCKALVINAITTLSANHALSLTNIIQSFNTSLKISLGDRRMGMCLCLAILDIKEMVIEICSTGMPFPLVFDRNNSEIKSLELRGQPLGFLKKLKLDSKIIKLLPGSSVIFISDGFDERRDPQDKLWGYQKVKTELLQICQQEESAESIANKLIAACDQFALGRPNDDDMTIIALYTKT